MLSHVNDDNQPQMVDVSGKTVTLRTAHARTLVTLPESVLELFSGSDLQSKKGPVFQTAIIAGITASKKTHELIPMCHPIGLEDCTVEIKLNDDDHVQIDCCTKVSHKTGVEMEALVGATTAALTVYDMCKGVSHDIVIGETRLIEKRGGKSDYDAKG
jgi:cyclic pyranopterin phosphate synthase